MSWSKNIAEIYSWPARVGAWHKNANALERALALYPDWEARTCTYQDDGFALDGVLYATEDWTSNLVGLQNLPAGALVLVFGTLVQEQPRLLGTPRARPCELYLRAFRDPGAPEADPRAAHLLSAGSHGELLLSENSTARFCVSCGTPTKSLQEQDKLAARYCPRCS